jgi:hypothetical protein
VSDLRILAESMARDLGQRGVHVAYVLIEPPRRFGTLCISRRAHSRSTSRSARSKKLGDQHGDHANLWGPLRCRCDCPVVVCGTEAGIAPAEGLFERVVQHRGTHVEEGLHCRPVPAHLLLLVHTLGHDLVDGTLHEGGRDWLAASTPGGIVHQCAFVALEVAQQLTDVPLETPDASQIPHRLALRPATQGRELAPTSRPAPMPQAPLRTLHSANRFVGQVRVGGARAKAASRLQNVLEAHRGVPPVEHDRGPRQRLALQPPQPGIAVAQHGRRRVRLHASHDERLLECVGRNRGAVAREGEAGLVAIGVDHLARDHLEMTLLVPVPTADVAAIKPNHDRFGLLGRDLLRRHGGMRLHNGFADPQRPVTHRAGVLRPADRKQLRQQGCDLAERRQRRIACRQIRQFWRHSRRLEVEDSEAPCPSGALAEVAADHVDTYLTWGEPPALVKQKLDHVRARAAARGRTLSYGLRVHLIVRETDQEAWDAANRLISHLSDETIALAQKRLREDTDSVGQIRQLDLHGGRRDKLENSPNLWAGVGLVRHGVGTTLVGSPETVAERLREYQSLGVQTIIASGYPHLEEAYRVAELLFPVLGIGQRAFEPGRDFRAAPSRIAEE